MQKKCIDTLIITNLPSFYKINLYNEIALYKSIFVIYTGDTSEGRNRDFFTGEARFDYLFLSSNKLKRLKEVFDQIRFFRYEELILGGWDSLPLWLAAFISFRTKNALVVESSYLESQTRGWKGLLKKIYISRISKVYASGRSQKKITDDLGFNGKTIITKGVGVFNYVPQPQFVPRNQICNFLYVGRLVTCKNIEMLIETFNGLPQKNLYIIGFGTLEEKLKKIANDNIHFWGAISNRELFKFYQKMDVFVLPSRSEPWGLVVEEALNNGLPVLVSNRVGCAEEIVTQGENGLVFRYDDKNDLLKCISMISDLKLYNKMRENISKMNFEQIEHEQINCYL